jgi:hypothetical protein
LYSGLVIVSSLLKLGTMAGVGVAEALPTM